MDNLLNMITLPNMISLLRLALDLFLVWILFYYLILIVKKNLRTLQIFKGILIILLVKLLTEALNLNTLGYLVNAVLMWGTVAIFVIFQPEIRAVLEKIGKATLTAPVNTNLDNTNKEHVLDEVTKAVQFFSVNHVGALISFEMNQSLQDYIQAGTQIHGDITYELLLTIFYEGTALHDGGMIIQGDKIACASAFYEPTTRELSPIYGARHRAALGLSEVSDALTIIVSEESGNVSFALKGELIKIPLVEFKERLALELGWGSVVKEEYKNE